METVKKVKTFEISLKNVSDRANGKSFSTKKVFKAQIYRWTCTLCSRSGVFQFKNELENVFTKNSRKKNATSNNIECENKWN